jgi:hypothetical protein
MNSEFHQATRSTAQTLLIKLKQVDQCDEDIAAQSLRTELFYVGRASASITRMGRVLEPFWQISHNAATAAGVTKKSRRFINFSSFLTTSVCLASYKASEYEISEHTDFRESMWGLTYAVFLMQLRQRFGLRYK